MDADVVRRRTGQVEVQDLNTGLVPVTEQRVRGGIAGDLDVDREPALFGVSPRSSLARTENEYVPGLRLNGVVKDQLWLVRLKLMGEMRYALDTSVPQEPSAASSSRVESLRREIVTLSRPSSSVAVPEKVTGYLVRPSAGGPTPAGSSTGA